MEGNDARSLGVTADPELQREIWQLRDQVFGLEGELARFQSALLEIDAARRGAESRAEYLDAARLQRDAMLASKRWRIGGLILQPLVALRRFFSRAHRGP
jgi:hypothetical protein